MRIHLRRAAANCASVILSIEVKSPSMPKRVRHHTSDEGLAGIRREMAIWVSRGWVPIINGVHVEVEPFGPTRPGTYGPLAELTSAGEGAYVEFDAPESMFEYTCGKRRSAIIPMPLGKTLSLIELNPRFVKVRRIWHEFWRAAD